MIPSLGPWALGHVIVQSLSRVWLFVTPWIAALRASLSFTISQSLLKLLSIQSVMPSNHLILCCPLLLWPSIFPRIRVFSNESTPCIRWPSIGASASTLVLPMSIQGWFPLGLTDLISPLSKGLSRVFSSCSSLLHSLKPSILRLSTFFMVQCSHLYWLLGKP